MIKKPKPRTLEVPGLGTVVKDHSLDWYFSEPMPLALLNGASCRVVLDGYDDDPAQADFHGAIANLKAASFSVLRAAEQHVFQYYQDMADQIDDERVRIDKPAEVWQHVRFGDKPVVGRRAWGDRAVYVSLECGCDWEPEHGMQIVLRHGNLVTKVGPYDGHLSNADSYADASLENVIYRGM